MGNVVSISPFRCRMWALHDRLEAGITAETCKSEIASFLKHGQLVPALGRPVNGDPDCDIELIYGARRLFVSRHINRSLRVELREMSDREAIIAMDIENRQRADVSPYERAISYAACLRAGHFGSQQELARALKISASQVSRLLSLAKLPAVVVNAFATPFDICEGWGVDLIERMIDPVHREQIIQRARALAKLRPTLSGADVYRQLITACVSAKARKHKAADEVVTDEIGCPLFRIRYQRKSIAFIVPADKVPRETLKELRTIVGSTLKAATKSTASGQAMEQLVSGRGPAFV